MSEQKRANLVTVDAAKKAKPKVPKTTRLTIDLSESNENVYPQFSYRELVRVEENRIKAELKAPATNGGKAQEPDPFFDNDEDVERIAKQFEQKYGGSSTYGRRKNRSKNDDFADIGAGYDENDSFIDNTDGYDEMMPPELDTAFGGFYINSGFLEFKNVPDNALNSDRASESDAPNHRKGSKRALSTSESDESSSDSMSPETDSSVQLEGPVSAKSENTATENKTDGNKSSTETSKKNKSSKLQTAPKKRRKQSSDTPIDTGQDGVAGTTPTIAPTNHITPATKTVRELLSDARNSKEPGANPENNEGSLDSHASDSVATKPIPSSDNAASSDSSCGPSGANKELSLPHPVSTVLSKLRTAVISNNGLPLVDKQLDPFLLEMETYLTKSGLSGAVRRMAYNKCAELYEFNSASRHKPRRALLQQRGKKLYLNKMAVANNNSGNNKDIDFAKRTQALTERLKTIIDQMRPKIVANYNTECMKILETNKQITAQNKNAESEDKKLPERRLPKRRYPWTQEIRSLLEELAKIQGEMRSAEGGCSKEEAAAVFLRDKIQPLFPTGFVRLPTLLQQAKINKNQKLPQELLAKRGPKPAEIKPSSSVIPVAKATPKMLPDQKTPAAEIPDANQQKQKSNAELLASMHLPLNTQVTIEKANRVSGANDAAPEKYTPPNNIGSITITPVSSMSVKPQVKLPNSVTITSNQPKNDPTHDQKVRVRPNTALYDKNILAKIHSGKNSDVDVVVRNDVGEKANGIRTEHVKTTETVKQTAVIKAPTPKPEPNPIRLNNLEKPRESAINQPPKRTSDFQSVLKLAIPASSTKTEAQVSPRMISPAPAIAKTPLEDEVPIVGSVIVKPTPSVKNPRIVNVDESSSDVEVIEVNPGSKNDPTAETEPSPSVNNCDSAKSKHLRSDETSNAAVVVRNDPEFDDSDISSVMNDLKELSNFHETSNGDNRFVNTAPKDTNIKLNSQDSRIFKSDFSNSTAFRKTD